MSNHSRQQRQTATDAFMQALGQLENVLQAESEVEPAVAKPVPTPPTASAQVDPSAQPTALPQPDLEAALEAAAADIEQFMNTHEA
ncbi:MAG: hypothetical protein ICV62_16985 [Cyanobacteria bacterium Co-bin13]|nr:hypothetical protein [Cyanobacteria bacterium Co-bin13]